MAVGGINKRTPPRKSGGIPRVSTRFSLSVEDEHADADAGRPSLSRETNFSGANGDRKIFIFPVQLSRCPSGLVGNLHTC